MYIIKPMPLGICKSWSSINYHAGIFEYRFCFTDWYVRMQKFVNLLSWIPTYYQEIRAERKVSTLQRTFTNLAKSVRVSTFGLPVVADDVGDDWITFMSSLGINNTFTNGKTQAKREIARLSGQITAATLRALTIEIAWLLEVILRRAYF